VSPQPLSANKGPEHRHRDGRGIRPRRGTVKGRQSCEPLRPLSEVINRAQRHRRGQRPISATRTSFHPVVSWISCQNGYIARSEALTVTGGEKLLGRQWHYQTLSDGN
jgi:hypothetical protein